MSVAESRVHDPALFLAECDGPAPTTSYLIILNQPVADFIVLDRLWKHTSYRICADGGANRLYDMFNRDMEAQRATYLPDAIHGDLDSLRDDVRAYYAGRGVQVTQDRDQDSTDFGKALELISSKSSSSAREIIILGSLSGRVDQAFRLLHDMIQEETGNPESRLWLFSETSISFNLRSGNNRILRTLSSGTFTHNVGIIPVYGPATISTSGLEWDVTDWYTQMGHEVSSSNHVKSDEIHIQATAPVLFTIQRAGLRSHNIGKAEK